MFAYKIFVVKDNKLFGWMYDHAGFYINRFTCLTWDPDPERWYLSPCGPGYHAYRKEATPKLIVGGVQNLTYYKVELDDIRPYDRYSRSYVDDNVVIAGRIRLVEKIC